MYADWLQENGQEQRAELIRVQIALAQIPQERADRLNDDTDWSLCDTESGIAASWCPNCGECSCPEPEYEKNHPDCPLHGTESLHCCLTDIGYRESSLRERERVLIFECREWIRGLIPGSVMSHWNPHTRIPYFALPGPADRPEPAFVNIDIVRGFVEVLSTPFPELQRHWKAITEHPDVVGPLRVELTDQPPIRVQEPTGGLWITQWLDMTSSDSIEVYQFGVDDGLSLDDTPNDLICRSLNRRFPGNAAGEVKWVLPTAHLFPWQQEIVDQAMAVDD